MGSTGGRKEGVPPESAAFTGNGAKSEERLTSLLCWSPCPSGNLGWWVPRECLMEMGVEIRGRIGGGKVGGEDLCSPLEIETEKEGRLQQVV